MKRNKIIAFIVLDLLIMLAVIPMFLPETYQVQRSITINAPAENVFVLVNQVENWAKWIPWAEEDETMKFQYGDQKQGVNAWYSWTSENSGGKLTILESIENQSIKTQLDFDGQSPAEGFWKFESDENSTKVTWGFGGKLAYSERYIGLFMDTFLGENFERGLANIKILAEK